MEQEKKTRNIEIIARHQQVNTYQRHASGNDGSAPPKNDIRKWGTLGLPILFLLGKLKWVAAIFKLTKFSTLITMFIAVWIYAQIWGAPFAIGFIVLIYIHEMGHALMMNRLGIKAGAPIFIPFVGAVISMKELPRNAYDESLTAAGGPILGTLGATLCLIIAWQLNSEFFFALASVGFMINLFNMLPISPLDGGRMTGVISRNIIIIGLLIGGYVYYKTSAPLLLIILIFGIISLFRENRMPEDYYNVSARQKQFIGILYFAMLFYMSAGMWIAEQPLKHLVL